MVIYTGSMGPAGRGMKPSSRRRTQYSYKSLSVVTSSSLPEALPQSSFLVALHPSYLSPRSSTTYKTKKKKKRQQQQQQQQQQKKTNKYVNRDVNVNLRHPSQTGVIWSALKEEYSPTTSATGRSVQQTRPFDHFVDVPSPFAKQKAPRITNGHSDPTSNRQHRDPFATYDFNSLPHPPDATSSHSVVPLADLTVPSDIPFSPVEDIDMRRASWESAGCLDGRARATNLRHTRPEWTTWDFLDLHIADLPPDIRTVDLWNNFKHEGEVDMIDIFVDRSGQKGRRGKLRFRPPPRHDFFSSRRYVLKLRDGTDWSVFIDIGRHQRRTFTRPSPVNENLRYPDITELDADTIDFGVLIAPETMLVKTTKHSDRDGKVKMILNLGRRAIDIRFPSVYSDKTREYKFLIPLDEAFDLTQCPGPTANETSFYLTLRKPPHFYKKLADDIKSTHEDAAFVWKEQDAWIRQTNILGQKHEAEQMRNHFVSLKNFPEGVINIGRWTTYRITFRGDAIDQEKYRVFKAALSDYNVRITRSESFKIVRNGACAWDLLEASLSDFDPTARPFSSPEAPQSLLLDVPATERNDISFPFSVRYQFEVCISNGWINEHNISREFLQALAQQDSDRAKQILETVAIEKLRFFDAMDIFKLRTRMLPSMKSRVPEGCVLIHSAVVTPSALILNTPYVEMTNRVIRRFHEHGDRFLRVRFEDDQLHGFSRIPATSQKTMDAVLNRVHRTLNQGIVIGDRKYDFLAAGNSQMREHGAYFFAASSTSPTTNEMRAWMGQFSHEKNVAKHAARIGQCFSTTRAIKNIEFSPLQQADLIDDVKKGSHIFTDGVGKISRFYAEAIAKELRLHGDPPSVFQFRMAGCKGVVAIAPDLGATSLQLRHSQWKFGTTYSGIEIIRWSEYWVASLNRQLITVLSALGVPNDVFLSMQEQELQLMERALTEDHAAMKALTAHVDPNRTTLTMASLVKAGFRQCNEPFVMSLLRLWRAWSIKYMKEKARLTVHKGAFILGCTDETGTLKGQFEANKFDDGDDFQTKVDKLPEVFVQITRPQSEQREVITGLCVVARNPSLHSGDMRVVKAVDVPALHHLVDVLVFPQTGDIDLCGMCSGGDLDGDDYVVIWDEKLLPRIWNAEPMDYTPPKTVPRERDVVLSDITAFFVRYMKHDFLPKIALAHLAWSDYLDDGIRHPTCLELAQLHSKAVDYPKSGKPAEMPKSLNAKRWPHFMEKKGRETYKSHKVLGQLYDSVERVAFTPDYDASFDERILNACQPDEAIMQSALELKRDYDTSIQRIMAQHDIKTEFEVWSTFVLDHSKASKDYKFHEEIGQLSSGIKKYYYQVVIDKAGGKDWARLVPWAVAMYTVTRDQLEAAKSQGEGARMPFISFPWLLSNTLIQIAKGIDKAVSSGQEAEGLVSNMTPSFNTETQMYDDPYQAPNNSEDGQCVVNSANDQMSPQPADGDVEPSRSDPSIRMGKLPGISGEPNSHLSHQPADSLPMSLLDEQSPSGSMQDVSPAISPSMTNSSSGVLPDTLTPSSKRSTAPDEAKSDTALLDCNGLNAGMHILDESIPLIDLGQVMRETSTPAPPLPRKELIGLELSESIPEGTPAHDLLYGVPTSNKLQPPLHALACLDSSSSTPISLIDTEQDLFMNSHVGFEYADSTHNSLSIPLTDNQPLNLIASRQGQDRRHFKSSASLSPVVLTKSPFDFGSDNGRGEGEGQGQDEDEDDDNVILMDPLTCVGETDVDRIIKLSGGTVGW